MNVRLLQPHRINKVRHETGAELFDLSEAQGKWLVDQKYAERIDDAVAVTPPRTARVLTRTAMPSLLAPKAVKPRFGCCGWK